MNNLVPLHSFLIEKKSFFIKTENLKNKIKHYKKTKKKKY